MRVPTTVRVRVLASTSNLGPAFDSLGLALDLPLRVRVRAEGRSWRIEYRGEGADLLRRGRSHLILQAMRRLASSTRSPLPAGLLVEVDNDIPVARGLGSSGAAIAAGLLAGNALAGTALPPSRLLDLGAGIEGHPENVAASLLGGLVLCARDGKGWDARRELPPAGWRACAFVPDRLGRTDSARRKLPARVPLATVVANLSATARLVRGLLRGSPEDLLAGTRDALHQDRRLASNGPLRRLLARLRGGGMPAFLSGSGPTLLALLRSGSPAERRFETLSLASRISGRVMLLDTTRTGGRTYTA
ncbi:MAG: homoserine kinase [Planctomycetes bacterium]|nr:homoserine kinase [Planctomycetota bacterium]